MSDQPIYLDYNATTPIDPAVAAEMLPYLNEHYGNPSSTHALGLKTRAAVEQARSRVAELIGARPEEILFTSGGSESNNTVIQGIARSKGDSGRHLITSAVEHPAVLEPCKALERDGFRVTVVPVDDTGRVSAAAVAEAITPETILISIMHANNEVGTLQPIAEIAQIARQKDVLFHTDAAQSIGKIPVRVDDLGVDYLSIAGHKVYAPKGIGALYIRTGRELPTLIHGAGHESGRRAGTENVLEIVGLGKACELAASRLEETGRHTIELRDRLWKTLRTELPNTQRNGNLDHALPNTLSVSFPGIDASTLLAEIGDRVAASAGAACHADGVDLSTVIEAMQLPLEFAMGTVRFSVGRATSAEEIDRAARLVVDAVGRLAGSEIILGEPQAESDDVRLTRYTKGLGCACKLRPQELEEVLRALPVTTDPSVLVDMATSDDAAVYRVRDDLALIQTVDFFTPIADNPEDFGAISAANSLSDIYAMGAEPIFALSVVGFPSQRLPLSVLQSILTGASRVAAEAGISILGGHSVEDTEPKFGLAVTGVAHPDAILTNGGGQPGDLLVLTKPIGTGIITTAIKRGLADPQVAAETIGSMRTLNRAAAEVLRDFDVHACTDVTGFGLLGHLREMLEGSEIDAEIDFDAVPLLTGARQLAASDSIPGGSLDNLEHVGPQVDWSDDRSRVDRILLADAQTSGGLLAAVAADQKDKLLQAMAAKGVDRPAVIGRLKGSGSGRIRVS